MKLQVFRSRESAGHALARLLAEAIAEQPDLTLGLSAGNTSLYAYAELVRLFHAKGGFSFRRVTCFNTDEYVGLLPGDPRSTRYIMNYHLFNQVDVQREQTYVPTGDAADIDAECSAYDLLIQARGGLDLLVLGLGHNGHIGLNEPGSTRGSHTRVVDLTPSTLAAVSGGERFKHLDETPSKAITLGMAEILNARKVLLIASGLGKSEIVHRVVRGRAGPSVPATLLLNHPDLTMIIDHDAASRLEQSDPRIRVLA
ncbi:MAG: glucosamine-6-phosphate deaminase [Planctomycetes bacterium]|nr:glucosamine-6-phosphate deaminase [Planctomycetota bacterium]